DSSHPRGLCGNPAATVSTGTSLVQPYDKKQDRRHPTHFRDSGNRSNGTTVHTSCNPVPSSSNHLPSGEPLQGRLTPVGLVTYLFISTGLEDAISPCASGIWHRPHP